MDGTERITYTTQIQRLEDIASRQEVEIAQLTASEQVLKAKLADSIRAERRTLAWADKVVEYVKQLHSGRSDSGHVQQLLASRPDKSVAVKEEDGQ